MNIFKQHLFIVLLKKVLFLSLLIVHVQAQAQVSTPILELDNPNDTVVYEKGHTHTIQWRDNLPHTLNIKLYKANAYIGELAASVPSSDSTFAWTVSTTLASAGDYRILITSNVDGSLVDYSDYFWIDDSLSTTIRVVTPSANDIWQMGECYPILWLDSIYADVKIDLYKGAAYQGSISSVTTSDGHYEWCLPSNLTSGNDYRIRIYSGVYTDYSAYFTITDGQHIEIATPNKRSVVQTGSSYSIDWIDNVPGDVIIRLYKGAAYQGLIIDSTSSDGQHYWTVPAGLTQGDNYRIMVQSITDGNVFDYSDYFWVYTQSNFPIEIVYPNVTSRLQHTKIYTALYIANLPDNVNLRLYKGVAYIDDIVLNTSNTGYYDFTISSAWSTGTDYRILVETINGTPLDYSDYFEISELLSIDVTYPISSTSWDIGSQNTIQWSDNIPENVIISLYKGGAFKTNIALNTESDGNYTWIVPNGLLIGTDYRFRVYSIDDGNITAYSDYFSISPILPVELLFFKAIQQNEKVLLAWATASEIDNDYFDIEYSMNGHDFEKIGRIEGNGSISEYSNYNFTHKTPINGHNYYRLKQVDFDGQSTYSSIQIVKMSSEDKDKINIELFPNPTYNGIINLKLSQSGQYKITVINTLGQIVLNDEFNGQNASFSLSTFHKGIYFIRTENQQSLEVTTKKLLFQ